MSGDIKDESKSCSLTISRTESWGQLDEAEERTNAEIHCLVLKLTSAPDNKKDELRKKISKLEQDVQRFRRAKKAELPIIEIPI